VPLAVRAGSPVSVPLAYGLATALPVVAIAWVLAVSAGAIGRTYDVLQRFAAWAQRITGWIFILAGIYLCAIYSFGLRLGF
jgi:threonine/homoserine/homoserine lactone efflux protein